MKDLRELNKYRIEVNLPDACYVGPKDAPIDQSRNGCFVLERNNVELRIIAGSGVGWDHISVSTENRCPTWEEMEYVARLFFKTDEIAMQLHVPEKDYINNHPFVLHWWRPISKLKKIPLPPKSLV